MWLHCDQKATRHGLHAYQGAVYLEAVSEHDFCLRVLEKSHNCHQYFFNTFTSARTKSINKEFYKLTKEQVLWQSQSGIWIHMVNVMLNVCLLIWLENCPLQNF